MVLQKKKTKAAGVEDEIVASGESLSLVSSWLGGKKDANETEETDAPAQRPSR